MTVVFKSCKMHFQPDDEPSTDETMLTESDTDPEAETVEAVKNLEVAMDQTDEVDG